MGISNLMRMLTVSIVASLCFGCATTSTRAVFELSQMRPLRIVGPAHETSMEHETSNEYVRNHRATVLYWWSNTCPCVRRYQSRIEALMTQYSPREIGFIAIASNSDETEDEIREVAKNRAFKLPMAIDHGGHWANALSVQRTPTIVILDSQGKLLFHGWIDNERMIGQSGRVAYLEEAIQRVLAGTYAYASSPVFGCRITKDLFGTDRDCDDLSSTPGGTGSAQRADFN